MTNWNFSSVLVSCGLEDTPKWLCAVGSIADIPPSTTLCLSAMRWYFRVNFYLQRHVWVSSCWKCDKSSCACCQMWVGCVCATFTALLYLTWCPPTEPGKAGRGWLQQMPEYFCSDACGGLGPRRGCGAALVPLRWARSVGAPEVSVAARRVTLWTQCALHLPWLLDRPPLCTQKEILRGGALQSPENTQVLRWR